jgi:beta-glucosidase
MTHSNPDYISDFSNGDVAADSYHKYAEDIKILKDLGVSMVRI